MTTEPLATSVAKGRTSSVDRVLRELLGCKPEPARPDVFMKALAVSFTTQQKAGGEKEWRWAGGGYVGQTTASGRITGAQAILYQEATQVRDRVLPLIDGLTPLIPAADLDNVEAIRAVVRTEVEQLTGELGRGIEEGYSRRGRVDELLFRLFQSPNPPPPQPLLRPAAVPWPGHLGDMQDIFGFDNADNVNTLDESQRYTNFEIIWRELRGLWISWNELQNVTEGDLGTILGQLSQALVNAGESVDAIRAAMDAALFEESERTSARFIEALAPGRGLPDNDLTVEDLLSWIESFASDEAPGIIERGGRRGARDLVRNLERLRNLVVVPPGPPPVDLLEFADRFIIDPILAASGSARVGGQLSGPLADETVRLREAILDVANHLNDARNLAFSV